MKATNLRFFLALAAMSLGLNAQAANPHFKVVTNYGEMIIELYPDKAPKTVENFTRYVNNGFYNGTSFHRVLNDFMIQGGAVTADFELKKTEAPIENESGNGLKNEPGTIAVARESDPHSGTSQFFINLDNNKHLNHYKPESYYYGYCVFGKIVKGMEVAKKIGAIPTGPGGPFEADVPKEKVIIETIAAYEMPVAAAPVATDKAPAKAAPAKSPSKTTAKKKDVKHG